MMPGLLLVLSAPSGAGKTTIARRLLAALGERGSFSVSVTTRAPRGQEQEGVDYRFVDPAAFQAMVERGELLEWAEVHGQWYGSEASTIDEARRGRVVIYDIDVQGGASIKARFPEAVTVFIEPPSSDELERRLRARGTDPERSIERRLLAAQSETLRGRATYDFLIVNQDLDQAEADMKAIVRAELLRRERALMG